MPNENRRRHERYATDVKVQFHVPYDFRTEVDFNLADQPVMEKHIGYSKNISTFGLCFESVKNVNPGDNLLLELHLPESKETIRMKGIARWSKENPAAAEGVKSYLTGVEIRSVDGVDVDKTLYYDEKYGIYWSELLERVLGAFSKMHKKSTAIIVSRGVLKDEQGRYLLVKRSAASKSWPSRWEFPGGKVEHGEHITAALKREFLEEVALEIKPLQRFVEFSYERPQDSVEYKIFFVERVSGEPAISAEHEAMGWFSLDELKKLDVSAPLIHVINRLSDI